MPDDPAAFVVRELNSTEPARQLAVIKHLKLISMALDLKKELIKEFEKLTAEEALPDEVAASLAKVLGEMSDLISPPDLTLLFPTLKKLCNADETAVRDAAVTSLNQISLKLDKPTLQKELCPIVLELAKVEWWAPKVSACGLCHTAYAAYGDEENRKIIAEQFKTLCKPDDGASLEKPNPMVASAAAQRLGDMLEAVKGAGIKPADMTEEKHGAKLDSLYMAFLQDDHDYVKVAAVKSSPAIFKNWDLSSEPGKLFFACASDKSWRVRVAVAEVLSAVAEAAKTAGHSCDAVQDICNRLLGDAESEVKHAIGERLASVTKALGNAKFSEEVFSSDNGLKKMFKDVNCQIREKLAGVIMEMAEPLGKDAARRLMVDEGLLAEMLNDENTNFRLACFDKLVKTNFLDTLRVAGIHQGPLFEILRPLAGNPNWRVRHAVMLLLPKLVRVFNEDKPADAEATLNKEFGYKLFYCEDNTEAGKTAMISKYGTELDVLPWALDPIAQIRKDYATSCLDIVEVLSGSEKDKRASPGGSWATSKILPVLETCCTEKEHKDKYHQRIVLLTGLCALGEYLKQEEVDKKTDIILDMAKETLENGSYVPSLRSMIARDLPGLARSVSKGTLQKVKDCLAVMEKDADPDVSGFAKESSAKL